MLAIIILKFIYVKKKKKLHKFFLHFNAGKEKKKRKGKN